MFPKSEPSPQLLRELFKEINEMKGRFYPRSDTELSPRTTIKSRDMTIYDLTSLLVCHDFTNKTNRSMLLQCLSRPSTQELIVNSNV